MNINEILKKIDIVDVISTYVNLTKKGQNYTCLCPFHIDKNPSLIVSPKKQIFKCFVCNTSGNVIKFVSLYKKCNLINAINEISNKFNLNLDVSKISKIDLEKSRIYSLNEMVAQWYYDFLMDSKNKEWLDYLLSRKISLKTIEYYKIGFANNTNIISKLCHNENNIRCLSDNNTNLIYSYNELEEYSITSLADPSNPKDFFINRIMFPIYDNDNNIVGFSGRSINNANPKYLNSKNTKVFIKSEVLYNINNIDNTNETLYIVEGFFDLLSLIEINIDNCIATMGVNLSKNHISILKSKNIKNIILCFDNDDAGINNTIKYCTELSSYFNVFVINPYDTKYKDFNEILINNKELLTTIINSYTHFSIYYLNYFLNSKPVELLNYEELISLINKYGSKTYLNEYAELINKFLKIDKNIILKDIKFNEHKYHLINNKNNTTSYYNQEIKIDNDIDILTLQTFKLQSRYLYLLEYMFYSYDYMVKIFSEIDFDVYFDKNFTLMNNTLFEYYNKFNFKTITTNKQKFKEYYSNLKQQPIKEYFLFQILDKVIEFKNNYTNNKLELLIIDTKILFHNITIQKLLKTNDIDINKIKGIKTKINNLKTMKLKYYK